MTHPTIDVHELQSEVLYIPIIGATPLIVHRFSEKAKQQMLDAQQGRKRPKERRDPDADYEASLYRTDDGGYGFPGVGFKAATVSAARFYDKSVTMTSLRQCLFVEGEYSEAAGQPLVRIDSEPKQRQDMVRIGQTTDLRFRGEFPKGWRATLQVTYITSMLSENSVLSLINAGGCYVGVGEWRPERRGEFGTYAIDRDCPIMRESQVAA